MIKTIIFSLLLLFQDSGIPEFKLYNGEYILPFNEYNLYQPLRNYLPPDDADVLIENTVFNVYADNVNNYYFNKIYKRNHNVVLKNITYNMIYNDSRFNYSYKEVYNNLKEK